MTDNGYYDGQNYYFYVKNHLGSNVMAVRKDGNIEQHNHYYPFGLTMSASTNQGGQPYKYTGKELDMEHGVMLYDYEARQYDPAIGRFLSIDPLAEKYYSISPYTYCMNNPVKYVDPDGAKPTLYEAALIANHVYSGYGNLSGGWKVSTQDFGKDVILKDAGSGLKSAVYERSLVGGGFEYTYATAGTDMSLYDLQGTINDWKTNFSQALSGESLQYGQSIDNSIELVKSLNGSELTFTGHSLGGGLASANALATGKDAITFNAAGLSDKTMLNPRYNLNQSTNIDAFIVQGEILDHIQTPLGLKATGTVHYLPATYIPQTQGTLDDMIRTFQRVMNHSMEQILKTIDKQ